MAKRKLVIFCGIGAVVLFLIVIAMLNSSSLPSATFNGHAGPTSTVAFSPNGALMASGTQMDGAITLCRWPGGEPRRTLKGDAQGTVNIAFSPNGTLLAACTLGWTIDVWRVADGTRIATLDCQPSHPQMAAFSSDPDAIYSLDDHNVRLGSSNYQATIRRWSITAGTSQSILERSVRGGAREFALSSDQSRLYLATPSGVELWDFDNRDAPLDVKLSPRALSSMALSKDGRLLATTAGIPSSLISVWDTAAETGYDLIQLGEDEYSSKLAFSPTDATLLAVIMYRVGTLASDIIFFDAVTKKEIARIAPAGDNVLSIAFSPDGRWLATGGDGPIKLWDLPKYLNRR